MARAAVPLSVHRRIESESQRAHCLGMALEEVLAHLQARIGKRIEDVRLLSGRRHAHHEPVVEGTLDEARRAREAGAGARRATGRTPAAMSSAIPYVFTPSLSP